MDPISQGVTGAIASQLIAKKQNIKVATWLGIAGGMAADLDIFIRSDADNLLGLMMHRHFTHGIVFIPIAALLAWLISPLLTKISTKRQTVLFFTIGYATHGFLDILTSYGTHFLWPFSNARIAFDVAPIVDFSFTFPILIFLLIRYLWKDERKWTFAALIWFFGYIGVGCIQHNRAINSLENHIQTRHNTKITKLRVLPTIGNLTLWRGIYVYGDQIYTVGIKAGFTEATRTIKGQDVKRFTAVPFSSTTIAGKDIERFKHFCDNFVGVDEKSGDLTDMRYSFLPQSKDVLWGLSLPNSSDKHCEFKKYNRRNKKSLINFIDLLMGSKPEQPQP